MMTWDIETEALPFEQIQQHMPPLDSAKVDGAVFGKFDPPTVALGNLKDEAKRQAKIDAARASHDEAVKATPDILEAALTQHVAKFMADAALSATTGRVLVIGYYSPAKDTVKIDGGGDGGEPKLLLNFWNTYARLRVENRPMVGLNICDFDLPFIARRSWMLGVDVPATAFDGRYFDRVFVDIRKRWLCGQHQNGTKSDFDAIAKAMGTKGKSGNGADFARLWHTDRDKAIAYLTEDVKQPAVWAARMGII